MCDACKRASVEARKPRRSTFAEGQDAVNYTHSRIGRLNRSSRSAKECDVMSTSTAKVLPSGRLSLKDRLSRLRFPGLAHCSAPRAARDPAKREHLGIQASPTMFSGARPFRLRFPNTWYGEPPVVTITLMAEARNRLHFRCNALPAGLRTRRCGVLADFGGKAGVGARRPPQAATERKPAGRGVARRASAERASGREPKRCRSRRSMLPGPGPTTGDQPLSGKTYRVALRARSRAIRIVPAPIFAPTRWALASTCCTCWPR